MDRSGSPSHAGVAAAEVEARPSAGSRAVGAGWLLLALTASLLAVGMWLRGTASDAADLSRIADLETFDYVDSIGFVAASAVLALAFALVGALIIARRPDNGVGWLFALDGVVLATLMVASVYAYRGLAGGPGSLPGGDVAAWITDVLYLPSFTLLTVHLFLFYPDGRLGSRRERRIAILATVGMLVGAAGTFFEPHLYGLPEVPHPFGWGIPQGVAYGLAGIGFIAIGVALVMAVVDLVLRLRRARGVERDRLRILIWAAVVGTVGLLPSFVGIAQTGPGLLIGVLGLLLIPISVGVAILRHGLFDIDLVIRRTVVFGVLAAFITLVYVAAVIAVPALLLGRSDTEGMNLLPFVAAAVIAIAFQPVRERAHRLAARLAYGHRASPYEVMARLASRMAGAFEAADLLPRIARVVGEGLRAERADVWLRTGRMLRPGGSWPPDATPRAPVALDGDRLPDLGADLVAPVSHDGELLGALTMNRAAGEPASATETRLLEDVASQAGIALRNVSLLEDLKASRQRLVAAQDQERRRLERDIHDGAQQQLVALAVKVQLADRAVDGDAEAAHRLLSEIQEETRDALETMRDLARGIYPPLLADEGLPAALHAQARKATMPVEVRSDGVGRYPPEIEATAYFCCLEALQNAAKYAEASTVRVELGVADGFLRFDVVDDGRGFDPAATPRGSGLQNMADRLEAVGGSLEVLASPGSGTRLIGRIPVASGATR